MDIIKSIQDYRINRAVNLVRRKGVSLRDPILSQIFGTGEEDKLVSPYSQLSVVYAAVRAKATNIAQVPFKLFVKGTDNEIVRGPVVDLFDTVNPYSSKYQLWEAIVTLLDITGEAVVVMDSETIGGVPVALWPVPRASMQARSQDGHFTGFTVKLNKQELFIPREQMIFNKYYNPADQVRGQSPLDACRLSLKSEWGAVQYNQSFFEKGSTIGAVYSTDSSLTPEQHKRLKHELINSRQGANHMHEAMLLEGGLKLQNTRPSNKDLEFLELRKFTREEVAMIYHVPKSELSLYEDVNYATAKSADASFWKKTLIPLMRLIEEQFNTDFLSAMNIEGHFDIKAVDVLNEDITEKADGALKFWSMGIPFNVINEVMNLGFPDIDTGNSSVFDLKMPAAMPVAAPPKGIDANLLKALSIDIEKPMEGEIDREEVLKRLRDAKWKSLMDPVLPVMGQTAKAIKNYYFDVEQRLLKKVNKHVKAAGEFDFNIVEDAFDDDKLRKAIEPGIAQSLATGVGSGVLPDELVLSLIASRGNRIVSINGNAKALVIDAIRKVLDQAIKEGWTELERADAINAAIKSSMSANKSNAKTIARTETHGAYEEGRWEGMKISQPSHKMWLSSRDDEVRHEHSIDGEKVPFDEPFSNGLMYPLDPAGDAGNVINCRCTFVALHDGGELNE